MPRVAKPWFRMYSSIRTNRKIQTLKGGDVLAWLNLMALASEQIPRGCLPDVDELAFQLRTNNKGMQSVLDRLITAGLVDRNGDCYVMHDWDEWQADRDVAPRKRDIDHGNVTVGVTEITLEKSREEESRKEKEENKNRPALTDPIDQIAADFASYGKVTSGTAKAIEFSVKDYGLEWVQQAVRECAGAGFDDNPPWSYVESALERWQEQGGPDEPIQFEPRQRERMGGNGAALAAVASPDPYGVKAKREFYMD